MRPFTPPKRRYGAIDITPLIDVVFMLLLFFVLTSVFVEPAVPVDLHVSREQQWPQTAEMTVVIDADERIFVNGDLTELADLEPRLRLVRAVDEAVIRSDSAVPYGLFFAVVDVLRRNGIEQLHLAHRVGTDGQ